MGNEYQRFLMHHGVKGQKWGERNGPPYPLKPNQRSAAERKAAGDTQGSVAVMAALTAISLAPVAISLASDAIKQHKNEKRLKKLAEETEANSNDKKYASERADEEIDPETGLYLTGKKMTTEENMERINPSVEVNDVFKMNCTCCTMAMELRERGYDVHAGTDGKKMLNYVGTTIDERSKNWYTGESPYDKIKSYDLYEDVVGGNQAKQFVSDLSKEPNTRGEVCVTWSLGGGHSMYYKTDKKGKLTIYDTQINKTYSGKEVEDLLDSCDWAGYTRLDNSTPNIQYLKDNNYIR